MMCLATFFGTSCSLVGMKGFGIDLSDCLMVRIRIRMIKSDTIPYIISHLPPPISCEVLKGWSGRLTYNTHNGDVGSGENDDIPSPLIAILPYLLAQAPGRCDKEYRYKENEEVERCVVQDGEQRVQS